MTGVALCTELGDLYQSRLTVRERSGRKESASIKIYWPGPGVHAAWPALVQGEREHLVVLLTHPSASPAARGGSANPAPYRETAWLDGLASWRHSPAGKTVRGPRGCNRSCRPGRQGGRHPAAQGPTPETRSTLM